MCILWFRYTIHRLRDMKFHWTHPQLQSQLHPLCIQSLSVKWEKRSNSQSQEAITAQNLCKILHTVLQSHVSGLTSLLHEYFSQTLSRIFNFSKCKALYKNLKQHLTSGCQEVLLLLLLMVCLSYSVNYEVEVCRSRFAWAVLKLHHLNTVFLNTCILFMIFSFQTDMAAPLIFTDQVCIVNYKCYH